MDIELAAFHEAGHAAMQWFVGWEPAKLHLTVQDSNATKAHTICPYPPLDNDPALRRRLLMLFAGNAVTLKRWPGRWNDGRDWEQVGVALATRFQRQIKWEPEPTWVPEDGRAVTDTVADAFMQDALAKCKEIIAEPKFQAAIDRISSALRAVTSAEGGVMELPGTEAVSICRAEITDDFRQKNPWSEWLNRQ